LWLKILVHVQECRNFFGGPLSRITTTLVRPGIFYGQIRIRILFASLRNFFVFLVRYVYKKKLNIRHTTFTQINEQVPTAVDEEGFGSFSAYSILLFLNG
jgi:hypothetical protein